MNGPAEHQARGLCVSTRHHTTQTCFFLLVKVLGSLLFTVERNLIFQPCLLFSADRYCAILLFMPLLFCALYAIACLCCFQAGFSAILCISSCGIYGGTAARLAPGLQQVLGSAYLGLTPC